MCDFFNSIFSFIFAIVLIVTVISVSTIVSNNINRNADIEMAKAGLEQCVSPNTRIITWQKECE